MHLLQFCVICASEKRDSFILGLLYFAFYFLLIKYSQNGYKEHQSPDQQFKDPNSIYSFLTLTSQNMINDCLFFGRNKTKLSINTHVLFLNTKKLTTKIRSSTIKYFKVNKKNEVL